MAFKVRMHNLDGGYYSLSGSITTGDGEVIKYTLPPDSVVEVDERVYKALKAKFSKPLVSEVPAALPNPQGGYDVPPTATRRDAHRQYLVEFLSD